jgi:hypothetical protein
MGIFDSLRRYEPDQVQRVFLSPVAAEVRARGHPGLLDGILAVAARKWDVRVK